MGCVASKLGEGGDVVSICRERKRLLKLAVERRAALAESHFRYCESLYAVSAAIRLFVARHSSPASPFLIAFSPTRPTTPLTSAAGDATTKSAMLLQQRPSEPTKGAVVPPASPKGLLSSDDFSECCCSSEGEEIEEREEGGGGGGRKAGFCEEDRNGYYYMEMQAQAESRGRDFGWDFFNPFFRMRPEAMEGYRHEDSHHLRTVREEEGIPELEDELVGEYAATAATKEGNEKENMAVVAERAVPEEVVGKEGHNVGDANGGGGGLSFVDDDPEKGRELLEALGDIEDHFTRAYDSGKDVSRMLEASHGVHLQSGLQGIKG